MDFGVTGMFVRCKISLLKLKRLIRFFQLFLFLYYNYASNFSQTSLQTPPLPLLKSDENDVCHLLATKRKKEYAVIINDVDKEKVCPTA